MRNEAIEEVMAYASSKETDTRENRSPSVFFHRPCGKLTFKEAIAQVLAPRSTEELPVASDSIFRFRLPPYSRLDGQLR